MRAPRLEGPVGRESRAPTHAKLGVVDRRDDVPTVAVPPESPQERGPSGGLRLYVLQGERAQTFLLPAAGEVVIGRSADADVTLDAASVSRRHAILHIGGRVELEDLGSVNGTLVRDQRLSPGRRVEIVPGEVIELGAFTLFLQPGSEGTAAAPQEQVMRRLDMLVERIAPSNISVLLLGETGVGKERIAQRIHQLSRRGSAPFLGINCAALPENLLESELFGYERGAFSGAAQAKPGLFETAAGGTIFLDEIGEMPLAMQAKLLRVVETRQVLRLGGLHLRSFDVRFVAATNRKLEDKIARGEFREDLFYRLNGLTLVIPPLRDRVDEIPVLAEELVAQAARAEGRESPPALSRQAVALLVAYRWPGNVRELRNVMERAVVLAGDGPVLPEHLQLAPALPGADAATRTEPELVNELRELERQRVVDALRAVAGNQSRAAKLLGISRGTLISRIQEFGLPQPRKRGGRR